MSFYAEDREKLEEAIRARERKYGYKRGSNASLTKPKEYANISESDFADPVGYNYPIDKAHIRGAITYWQHMDHRKAYSDPKARAFITERIVRAALKFGVEITYNPKDPDYRKLPEILKKRMKGYGQKSMLENVAGFRAYQEAWFKSQEARLRANENQGSLREKLDSLMNQRKKLQSELDSLWQEQQVETKPIDEKYGQKRKELQLEIEKLSSEIEILQHAIAEKIAH